MDYYVAQAKEACVAPLRQSVSFLFDLPTLKHLGSTTEFSHLNAKTIDAHQDALIWEDDKATQAFQLAMNLAKFRCSSIAGHCQFWPGLLALFASPAESDHLNGLLRLRTDWRAYKAARDKAPANPFLGKLRRKSPFDTTPMSEIGEAVDVGLADQDVLGEVCPVALAIFRGWGQTKVLEDCVNKLRDREERDVKNRKVGGLSAMGSLA